MFELADYLRVIPGYKLLPRSFDRIVPTALSQLPTRFIPPHQRLPLHMEKATVVILYALTSLTGVIETDSPC